MLIRTFTNTETGVVTMKYTNIRQLKKKASTAMEGILTAKCSVKTGRSTKFPFCIVERSYAIFIKLQAMKSKHHDLNGGYRQRWRYHVISDHAITRSVFGLVHFARASRHVHHDTPMIRSRDRQVPIYGHMWQKLTHSLTHVEFPGILVAINAVVFKNAP